MIILLFLLWIVLNSRITLEIVILGIIIVAAIYLFMIKYLHYNYKVEWKLLKLTPDIFKYMFFLLGAIITSSLTIIKLLLINDNSKGAIARFDIDLKSDLSRAIYANTITITPGTLTIKLDGVHYIVHGVTENHIKNITDNKFVKMLQMMEAKYYE